MIGKKQAQDLMHTVIREHKVRPQIGEFAPNGEPIVLCKCSDMTDYTANGWTDHLEVQMLDAFYDAFGDDELNPDPNVHTHPFGEANCTICHP